MVKRRGDRADVASYVSTAGFIVCKYFCRQLASETKTGLTNVPAGKVKLPQRLKPTFVGLMAARLEAVPLQNRSSRNRL
jgi:hypothetical protein